MSEDQIGQLAYLTLLGAALIAWNFRSAAKNLNKTLQHAVLWVLIFIGVAAAIGLWTDLRHDLMPRQTVFAEEQRIEIPRARDGQYHAEILVNGAPIRFVVDTGASSIVLSKTDAARAGLHPEDLVFLSNAMTANGPVATAPVRLDDVAFGPFTDQNLRAYVNDSDLDFSLLGMSYLNLFDRIEISGGTLILER